MHVTTIKPTRSSNTLILVFSNGSILPFSADDWVRMGIKKFSELNPDSLAQIYQKSAEHQLWEYSLRQLAMHSQPEKIISQKLKNYSKKIFLSAGINSSSVEIPSIIATIISRLKDRGLINNSGYAQSFARKSHNKSKRQIVAELNQKGINRSDQNLAVSNLDDKAKILEFLKKKKYTPKNFIDRLGKNKIMAALYRRGFNLSDIKSVVDDLLNRR